MTAIQQLMEDLDSFIFGDLKLTTKDIWNKALKNEKQQLNDAYNSDRPNLTCYEENTAFKEYYNEKFKK